MKRMRKIGIAIVAILTLLVGGLGWSTARMWRHAMLNQELLMAAGKGDTAGLKRALQRGADPNAPASSRTLSPWERIVQALRHRSAAQSTPALLVAMQGHSNLAEILLKHGADPNCHGVRGTPALMDAVATYDLRLVGELLAHGAKPNAANADGDTALMWAAGERLSWGGHHYDMSLVKMLLEYGADANAHNHQGQAPLMWAIGLPVVGAPPSGRSVSDNGSVMVETLVVHGADVNAIDQAGDSVLAWSAQLEPGLLPWLIAHGARVNARMVSNQFGFTQRRDTGVNGWTTSFGASGGNTVLMMFAGRSDRSMVQLLLMHGADVNATNDQGKTALRLATDPQIRALLRRAGEQN